MSVRPFLQSASEKDTRNPKVLGSEAIKVLKMISLSLFLGLLALPVSAQTHSYTGMVSFGDSLSDLGNTVARLTLLGEPFLRESTGYNGNFYYNGRFSDGPLWSERLNDMLGFGTMLRNDGSEVLSGTNFAWAGSTSGTGSHNLLLPNLRTQVGFYTSQIGSNPILPAPATTLYTVWSGGNDVINLVNSGTAITPSQVAENISIAITNLYNAGGRTFLVPNLPPLGFKPDFIGDDAKREAANDFVESYNVLLSNTLDSLSGLLAGSDIIKLDINNLFFDILADPASYGFLDISGTAYTPFTGTNPPEPYGAVVSNPEQFLFWDYSHGTTTANALFTSLAYEALAIPEPSTAILLVTGLWVFVGSRRRRCSSF